MALREKNCFMCICGFFICVALIIVGFGIYEFIEYDNIIQADCDIYHLEYPTHLPNKTDDEYWENCDCGDECTDKTVTLTMYAKIPELENKTFKLKESRVTSSKYTFYDKTCSIDIDNKRKKEELLEIKEKVIEYTNKTIECYVRDEYSTVAYIHYELFYEVLIAGSIFLLIFCACFICIACSEREKNYGSVEV